MKRITDERLNEIECLVELFGADHPEAGPQVTTLESELLQALKAERETVDDLEKALDIGPDNGKNANV